VLAAFKGSRATPPVQDFALTSEFWQGSWSDSGGKHIRLFIPPQDFRRAALIQRQVAIAGAKRAQGLRWSSLGLASGLLDKQETGVCTLVPMRFWEATGLLRVKEVS